MKHFLPHTFVSTFRLHYPRYSAEDHDFWKTQPVSSLEDVWEGKVGEAGAIDEPKTVKDIQVEGLDMPTGFDKAGFEWCSVDVTVDEEINDLYTLLNENYVEDGECNFRFDYSIAFIRWALTVPEYLKDWHVGIRNKVTKKLYAFISAIPARVRIHATSMPMVEINFLCVHKNLRAKRLAPVLIKEVTRRVNLQDVWQAVYTAGVVLPKPVARCRYWHRSLNVKKLVEVGFSRLHPRMTMQATIKKFKLPDRTQFHLSRLVPEDVDSAHALLSRYLKTK